MHILFYHSDRFAQDYITLCLRGRIGAAVTSVADFQSAIDIFLSDTVVDLLIVDQHAETPKLFKYLGSVDSQIPVIVLIDKNENAMVESSFPDLKIMGLIPNHGLPDELTDFIQKLSLNTKENSGLDKDYCKISTDLLVRVAPLKGDVYIRLSQIKFVKFFRAGATFSRDDFKRFLEKKKLDHLYIHRNDLEEFVKKLKNDVLHHLNTKLEPGPEGAKQLADIHATVHELTHKLGFTPEVLEIAKANIDLTMQFIGKHPKLNEFMDKSKLDTNSYLSSHSVMLAHLSCCIAAQMEWPSSQTFSKLTIAAFFHDMTLTNDNYASIQTRADLDALKSSLPPNVYQEILAHPHAASNLISKIQDIPPDVDVIIVQHHERPDESGFPHQLGATKISPLAAVLIVAHEMVREIIKQGSNFEIKQFAEQRKELYARGTFKKIYNVLINSDNPSLAESA